MKKIEIGTPVKKPMFILKQIVRLVSWVLTRGKKVTWKYENCENVDFNEPYVIISTHASLIDFAWIYKLTKPKQTAYIASVEEFIGREWLLRNISAFPKKKHTKDIQVVKNSFRAVKTLKLPLTIFPEAKFSFVGIREKIDPIAISKMVKKLEVPIIVFYTYGDLLYEPQWDKKHYRDNPFELIVKCIVTKDEIANISVEDLADRIDKAYQYDEYEWLYQNNHKITSEYRANNIHRILYKCPHCGSDYSMRSKLTNFWCENCKVNYHMDERCRIASTNAETKFVRVQDWWKWEREEVKKEVLSGKYHYETMVRIEHLDNSHTGYRDLGFVKFVHDMDGIHLNGTLKDGSEFSYHTAPHETPSVHIDYNYHKTGIVKPGPGVCIGNKNDTWFILPQTTDDVITKIMMATEALYEKNQEEQNA